MNEPSSCLALARLRGQGWRPRRPRRGAARRRRLRQPVRPFGAAHLLAESGATDAEDLWVLLLHYPVELTARLSGVARLRLAPSSSAQLPLCWRSCRFLTNTLSSGHYEVRKKWSASALLSTFSQKFLFFPTFSYFFLLFPLFSYFSPEIR